ncbi:uncharacterized protein FYW47_003904 [Aplochiton taeniatus]
MTLPDVMIVVMGLAAMATVAVAVGEENELDYGYWNYREGADSVNVASVRSVTRLLDVWGKRIFNEVKTLLHSQPSALLPDYSRVRPLSESLNDLFREVSLLHRRVNELTHRLATMGPVLRRHGYRDEQDDEEEAAAAAAAATAAEGGGGIRVPLAPRSVRGGPSLRYTTVRRTPTRGTRVVRRRRVKVYQNGPVRVIESER